MKLAATDTRSKNPIPQCFTVNFQATQLRALGHHCGRWRRASLRRLARLHMSALHYWTKMGGHPHMLRTKGLLPWLLRIYRFFLGWSWVCTECPFIPAVIARMKAKATALG
jgi:hypothetical protein